MRERFLVSSGINGDQSKPKVIEIPAKFRSTWPTVKANTDPTEMANFNSENISDHTKLWFGGSPKTNVCVPNVLFLPKQLPLNYWESISRVWLRLNATISFETTSTGQAQTYRQQIGHLFNRGLLWLQTRVSTLQRKAISESKRIWSWMTTKISRHGQTQGY